MGMSNVLTSMDEVFGRSYHMPYSQNSALPPPANGNGCTKLSDNSSSTTNWEAVSAGHKLENGAGLVLANCNRTKNPAAVDPAVNHSTNSQLQQMPPSYQSAITTPVTGAGNWSPTRGGQQIRNTVEGNCRPVGQQQQQQQNHDLKEQSLGSLDRTNSHSNCDVLL